LLPPAGRAAGIGRSARRFSELSEPGREFESDQMHDVQPARAAMKEQIRRTAANASRLLSRFASEEDGQDIVEYAFLAAFIGVTSYLALNGIRDAVGDAYDSWLDPDVGVPSAWNPPEPPAPPPAGGGP
jgi:Flp pilus assembly pilin Flp